MNTPPPVHVAIAILQQQDKFLLQLRDNIPTIVYPGHWACFGGHIEPGETPVAALEREILEEINFQVANPHFYRLFSDTQVIRHVFACALTVPLSQLDLHEGWDMGLFSVANIQQGQCFSTRDQQLRPLALPHQTLLLDFIQSSVRTTEQNGD